MSAPTRRANRTYVLITSYGVLDPAIRPRPTLLVHGDLDRLVPIENSRRMHQ